MKYNVLIFDMDGTILDTLEDMRLCMNYALRQSGFPERTPDEIRSFVGNGLHKLTERAVPEGTPEDVTERVFAELMAYYQAHCTDYTRPYDGIPETIRTLHGMGYRTAVVSNKADAAVQELVKEFFDGLFDVALGEKDGMKKKPAPDAVEYVLRKLGADRSDAVYIGDSEVDIATAENSKVDSIIVEWGFRDREFLKERGAKVFAKTPSDLLAILEGD